MIRLLPVLLALAACVPATQGGFGPGVADIAAQRMRFAAEAVCLNNRTRAGQDRAARALNFPVRERDGDATIYANPGTLTFVRIGPAPVQTFTDDQGRRQAVGGDGCSVGSPAVGTERANRLAGEILAPRLVDGSDTLLAPRGAGRNVDGGVGFFFDNLSVTLPVARTTFTNPETGEGAAFDHPVILIVHR
ncbi:hypothetical protein MWU52_11400 [Jannaschia sp. S6380]|uniref:hypothetical protein n=1 Tax=Jannaschia sp. S6380 TaxID=2926408 RepID=UPI001FF18E05|nr:hypothetical protein [Jannaschia sp. S6380]MCK0168160.1 hypothetical protein [Jannaschia sp. S6380]